MDIKDKVINPEFKDSLTTIKEFRETYAKGVTPQAITYAMENDLIDFVDVGPRVKIIVLTEKTLRYNPNRSDKRTFRTTDSLEN